MPSTIARTRTFMSGARIDKNLHSHTRSNMTTPVVNLTKKVALVTGASSGIGWATSILFKKLGASVLLTGRNEAKLGELQKELQKIEGDGQVHIIAADLAREDDIKRIAEAVKEKYGKLDVLVNNAGILEMGSIENTTLETYDRIMNVNVRSIFQLTNLLVPMLAETRGSIVSVSSVNGIRSFAGVLAYNISKAALDQFTHCVALELAPKGIRVNSINPGVIVTNLHERAGMDTAAYAKFLERAKETHPLGRPGNADECAAAIAFLASDAASFSTGVTLPVDGGRHAACPR